MDKLIMRFESRSGKHWVELYEADFRGGKCYHYTAPGSGGNMGLTDRQAAKAEMRRLVDLGLFQPDANTTPMRLVQEG